MKNKIILAAGVLVAVIIYGNQLEDFSKNFNKSTTAEIGVDVKTQPASFRHHRPVGRKPMKYRSFI